MNRTAVTVRRLPDQLTSDDKRVIARYFDIGQPPRIRSIFKRLLKIPPEEVTDALRRVMTGFSGRHRDLEGEFRKNFDVAARHVRGTDRLGDQHKLLIGAYFTMEYSIESAALFNPSVVAHPDQAGLSDGELRFLMSLRATGEGHVSSIVFRKGVLHRDGTMTFDPPPRFAYTVRPVADRIYDKAVYARRLRDHGLGDGPVSFVLAELPEAFTLGQLRATLKRLRRAPEVKVGFKRLSRTMLWEAQASYSLSFPPDHRPSENVIFPATPYESRGMEDVRLVRFTDDDGSVTYYGTYTAFDGFGIYPMLLETRDFHNFHVMPLAGRYARNKGHALFPRKVGGQYMMVSRHDAENLHLLRSNDLRVWNQAEKIQSPKETWELVHLGNCGSPIETEAGWLLVTHGVGPMRRYCIGASLLDLEDPSKVLGRLRLPMLTPVEAEREGYVPNVVYSCGSLIHRGRLVVPYAMSDSRTSFASISVRALVRKLLEAHYPRPRWGSGPHIPRISGLRHAPGNISAPVERMRKAPGRSPGGLS